MIEAMEKQVTNGNVESMSRDYNGIEINQENYSDEAEEYNMEEAGKKIEESGVASMQTYQERSEIELCGIASWKPQFLQVFANISFFTGLYSVAGLVTQSLSIYVNSQVPNLEKQFGLTSSETGFLMSCNDIGFMICTLFVSGFAQFIHIPKVLSFCLLLYGLSGILCIIPNFVGNSRMYGLYGDKYTLVDDRIQLCKSNTSTDWDANLDCTETDQELSFVSMYSQKNLAIAVIAIGMLLQGIGKAPRSPFITVYVDDSVDKRKTAYYIGIMLCFGIFGPAVAYGFGGICSKMYVTLEDVSITPKDPRWIGAWWLGFLVFGIVSIFVAIPVLCFPRRLYSKHRKQSIMPENLTTGAKLAFKDRAKERILSYWRIIYNPVYCLFVATNCNQVLSSNIYIAFLSKYVQTQFGIPLWKTNFIIAISLLCSSALGFYLGGLLTKKVRMTPPNTLKLLWLFFVVQISFFVFAFFLGCNQPNINGYDTSNISYSNCSTNCSCNHSVFFPVCGSDGVNYYSPCYAGCSKMNAVGSVYTDCLCIPGGKASSGFCESSCQTLYPWAVFLFLSNLFGAMKGMCSYIGKIRSVEDRDKSTAIGLQTFMMALTAFMPGPLIAGKIVDTTCLVWENTCSSRGSCELYNIVDFRIKIHGFSLLFQSIAMCTTFAGFILVRKWKDWPHLNLYTDDQKHSDTGK